MSTPHRQNLLFDKMQQPVDSGNVVQHTLFAAEKTLQKAGSYNKEEVIEKICLCLETLPAKYKEVIDLHFFQNKSIEEIITIIDMSESTVRNRLGYGLFLLRKRLLIN